MPSEREEFCNVVDVEYKINQSIDKHQEIEKHKKHCEELNSDLDLSQKYNKKYASIQREINMIRDQNTIGHLKDLLNKKNKIVDRYKRKLIEAQQNIGQEKYGDCIKYDCQTNLEEISHTVEKLIKAGEKVEF